jgi:hypothetical protein
MNLYPNRKDSATEVAIKIMLKQNRTRTESGFNYTRTTDLQRPASYQKKFEKIKKKKYIECVAFDLYFYIKIVHVRNKINRSI